MIADQRLETGGGRLEEEGYRLQEDSLKSQVFSPKSQGRGRAMRAGFGLWALGFGKKQGVD